MRRRTSANRYALFSNYRQSLPVQGRPTANTDAEWMTFASQNEAARTLTVAQGMRFNQGAISKVVLGKASSTNGWTFRFAQPTV
jgi:hypothetical protein